MKELEKDMNLLRVGMKEVERELEFYRGQQVLSGDRYICSLYQRFKLLLPYLLTYLPTYSCLVIYSATYLPTYLRIFLSTFLAIPSYLPTFLTDLPAYT